MGKQTNEFISPFSSGTEAMCWVDENCDRCVKSFKPSNGEMPDYNTTQKLVNLGRECKMKFAIDVGFVTGEIPLEIAQSIGYTEEKGFPSSCLHFSDNDDDGFKTSPRKPKDEPPNQMCLPFVTNEILVNHNKGELV